MPGGSNGDACVMAVWTSTAAPSRLRARSSVSVMDVTPSALDDVIVSSPGMVENWRSSGVATADAMVSGLAPGRLAFTTSVGKSTLGRSLTGSARYATIPNRAMASINRAVATGRRMKRSEMVMLPLCCGFLDLNVTARYEPDVAFGDDGLSGLETLLDHLVGVDPDTAHHRAGFNGHVGLDDENVVALLPGLHRLRGHHGGVLDRSQPQSHAHEFARPQRPIRVGEGSL